MSMDINELKAESSAELLPGREALGRLRFRFARTADFARHANVNDVQATNTATDTSTALNIHSAGATAASEAAQTITVSQV
jgi:hypothetical protein